MQENRLASDQNIISGAFAVKGGSGKVIIIGPGQAFEIAQVTILNYAAMKVAWHWISAACKNMEKVRPAIMLGVNNLIKPVTSFQRV